MSNQPLARTWASCLGVYDCSKNRRFSASLSAYRTNTQLRFLWIADLYQYEYQSLQVTNVARKEQSSCNLLGNALRSSRAPFKMEIRLSTAWVSGRAHSAVLADESTPLSRRSPSPSGRKQRGRKESRREAGKSPGGGQSTL